VIIFDDADSLSDGLLEMLRLLANFDMDSQDRCSFILSGSQRLAARIRLPQNESLKQRIGFSHPLRGFTIDDAVDYDKFHLKRAEAPAELFVVCSLKLRIRRSPVGKFHRDGICLCHGTQLIPSSHNLYR